MLSEIPLSLSQISPVEIVDLLLAVMNRRSYSALLVEPGEHHHRIVVEPSGAELCTPVPALLGDAIVARLGLIAGIPLESTYAQFGRIQAKYSGEEVTLFLGMRPTLQGLSAELWKLASESTADIGADGSSMEHYDLEGEIGTGGMGVVFRAIHKPLNRPVAIKILHERYSQDAIAVKRFVREARAASRLNHPGIVAVYDFGVTPSGRSFLVMELVEGASLRASIREPFVPLRAVQIMRQLVAAISAMHEVGIVHRDLKPDNIFIGPNDIAKIGDFGAAKDNSNQTLGNITQPGLIFGTPPYMSPEHIQGGSTDHRTDLYALGCIFFEMLTGRQPYRGKNVMEVFHLHVTAPPPEVNSPHGSLPPIFNDIIERALAKDYDERYQSGQDMLADLEHAQSALLRNNIKTGWRRWLSKAE